MAIDIVVPDTVLKSLNGLPKEIRVKFWEQLERLVDNPGYPSLRNEKLKGTDHWAFSITMHYRATYIRGAAAIVITAIGTHMVVLEDTANLAFSRYEEGARYEAKNNKDR